MSVYSTYDKDDEPAMDVDLDQLDKVFDMAEAAEATVALTGKGRLVFYGSQLDAPEAAKAINRPGSGAEFNVEVLGDHVLGIVS